MKEKTRSLNGPNRSIRGSSLIYILLTISIIVAVAPTSATGLEGAGDSLKNDIVEALNGTPYFEVSEPNALNIIYGVDKINHIDVDLNVTSNPSDSERASKLVLETLFKDPSVLGVSVSCEAMYWDRLGKIIRPIHSYEMTRADAEQVDDWSNLDLNRFDQFQSDSPGLPSDSEINQHLARFGVQIPAASHTLTGNAKSG